MTTGKIASHFYWSCPAMPNWRVGMFEYGGEEGEGGSQEGENKAQGQPKPRLQFPVCPESGDFPSFRARVLLITCYSVKGNNQHD